MSEFFQKYRELLKGRKVAFFSMEIGLAPEMHTYSGGLGILAGDTVRSAADLRIPFVAITLLCKKGYFRQQLSPDGKQIEHPDQWQPENFLTPLQEIVEMQIQNRPVKIKSWLFVQKSSVGTNVPVLFLDTDIPENHPEDRDITSFLYGDDGTYRIKQELVLGIGGFSLLDKLGIEVIKYHLNEGHASFVTLKLMQKFNMDVNKVRSLCVFTTHTPVEAGHDKFSYGHIEKIMSNTIPLDVLKKYAGDSVLNMTLLALNLSGFINGVAKKHRETTQKMFPGYVIRSVTNGIHSFTWTHPAFRKLYDKYLPGWAIEPELLVRVAIVPNEEIWETHLQAKKELIDFVNSKTDKNLSYDDLTLGFARRATAYKRHSLIFSDLERLKKISKKHKFQIIFAGKAHPKDFAGKKTIEDVFSFAQQLKDFIKIVYLENYDIEIAQKLIPGVDVWLNTPLRPLEASGTSGMKAAHNAVINFSVPDGWWAEGCIEGVTGWSIGTCSDVNLSPDDIYALEKEDIYGKLEYDILPLFYEKRDDWIEMMEHSIGKIAYYFNSHRMMRRYITEAYFS